MRVRVYIDGFNLYYRCLRKTPFKWLDVKQLSQLLLGEEYQIECIKYFTADVSPRSGDEGAPLRQQAYIRALKTIPELEVYKGNFLAKVISRPLVDDPTKFVRVHDTEEKGSDVNLASHLLMDGFCEAFDVALVISQDTDLIEPIRMVVTELEKPVIMGWSEKDSPSKKHKLLASRFPRIRRSTLSKAQFANPVIGQGGAKIYCPAEWRVGENP